MQKRLGLFFALIAAALAACSGGGGSTTTNAAGGLVFSTPTPTPPTPPPTPMPTLAPDAIPTNVVVNPSFALAGTPATPGPVASNAVSGTPVTVPTGWYICQNKS